MQTSSIKLAPCAHAIGGVNFVSIDNFNYSVDYIGSNYNYTGCIHLHYSKGRTFRARLFCRFNPRDYLLAISAMRYGKTWHVYNPKTTDLLPASYVFRT